MAGDGLRSDPVDEEAREDRATLRRDARVLLDVAGVPDPHLLRQHLWLSQVDLPSRAPAKAARVVNDLSGQHAAPVENIIVSAEDARRRLPEFNAELQRAQEFEQSQDTLYELQQRLADMNKGASVVIELDKQVRELTHKADAYRKVNEIARTSRRASRSSPRSSPGATPRSRRCARSAPSTSRASRPRRTLRR